MRRDGQGLRLPDGIDAGDADRGALRRSNPWSLLVLGAIVALGLSGYAGGRDGDAAAESESAHLHVHWPSVIRNGHVYESILTVRARKPIEKLVLAVPGAMLRELTLNAMYPAAGDESYVDGDYRYAFGRLEAGDTFVVRVEMQINPALFGFSRGHVRLLDDKRALTGLDVSMLVLP